METRERLRTVLVLDLVGGWCAGSCTSQLQRSGLGYGPLCFRAVNPEQSCSTSVRLDNELYAAALRVVLLYTGDSLTIQRSVPRAFRYRNKRIRVRGTIQDYKFDMSELSRYLCNYRGLKVNQWKADHWTLFHRQN